MAMDFEIVMCYKGLKNYSITSKSPLQQSIKDGCGGEIRTLHHRSVRMKSFSSSGVWSQELGPCPHTHFWIVWGKLFWCPITHYLSKWWEGGERSRQLSGVCLTPLYSVCWILQCISSVKILLEEVKGMNLL